MQVSDFNYELPEELIAQTPIKKRDESRLMVLDRSKRTIEHKIFKDIIDYLKPGDVLVRNNTKVIPARIYGKKETGANTTGSKARFSLVPCVCYRVLRFYHDQESHGKISNFEFKSKSGCKSTGRKCFITAWHTNVDGD